LAQAGLAIFGDPYHAPISLNHPTEHNETIEKGRTQPASKMGTLLAPVKAVQDKRPS
jgi:hypothetical protein